MGLCHSPSKELSKFRLLPLCQYHSEYLSQKADHLSKFLQLTPHLHNNLSVRTLPPVVQFFPLKIKLSTSECRVEVPLFLNCLQHYGVGVGQIL